MESKVVGVCAMVAVLGIISAAAGFAAEVTKVKASDVFIDTSYTCIYPSSPAFGLGIGAALFAIIVRIVISVFVGGCSTCCRTDPNSSPFSRLFHILSWVASVVAVVLLLAAAGLNHRQGGQVDAYGYVICYVPKPGIFATGAVCSLLSAFFGIVAYVSITNSATQTTTNPTPTFPAAYNYNADLEKSPVPLQQMPPQQYPPAPQQY